MLIKKSLFRTILLQSTAICNVNVLEASQLCERNIATDMNRCIRMSLGNTIGSIAVINIFGVTFGRASSINKNLNLVSGTSAVTGGVNIVTLAFIQRQRCVAQNHVSARYRDAYRLRLNPRRCCLSALY